MPNATCPSIITNGSCATPNCPYNHTPFTCDLCKVFCGNAVSLEAHKGGKMHKRALEGFVSWQCWICDIRKPPVYVTFAQHELTGRHRNRLNQLLAVRGEPEYDDDDYEDVKCTACNMIVKPSLWTVHLESPYHRRKQKFVTYEVALVDAGKDKFGVKVEEEELDFGVIELSSLRLRPTTEKAFHIRPTKNTVTLAEARISSTVGEFSQFREVHFTPRLTAGVLLSRDRLFSLKIDFDPHGNRGTYEDRLELIFEDRMAGRRFVIVRLVKATVGIQADLTLLAPTAPYRAPKPRERDPEATVIDGIPPPQLAAITWVNQLPFADIPTFIRALVDGGSVAEKLKRVRRDLLPRYLDARTYGQHWNNLLWLEEIQAETDMQNYDQTNVPFVAQNARYYYLEVPGLAEKRPSVIISDRIKVRNHAQRNDHWFRGYVHRVEQSQVGLAFSPSFSSIRGQRYDVRFELNRLVLKRMHQAASCEHQSESRVLFPKAEDVSRARMRMPSTQTLTKYRPFDRQIASNPPQWLAVTSIAELKPGCVPFVVFGPPGTGKTVVIVEAIRQILTSNPAAKILACAPSNSAADIIAERLSRVLTNRELFRMNAPTRDKDSMPLGLKLFSSLSADGTFSIPAPAKLKAYRVVVSTCVSASVPYGVGVEHGHFTHVFVDEAGQASEPEAMIPVKMNAGPNTNIILAGDPKQLGPIVRSPIAEKLGLGVSWLDRLMSLPLYEPRVYSGVTVVKLLKNWRSHRSILKFPNAEFYRDELQAHADPVIVDSLLRFWQLPRQGFPIIFNAIKGKDERQASSPSFFNIQEASAVRDYVKELKMGLGLTDNHIGIISPYNAQCQKIRQILRQQYPTVKVGSVEEFQGQERRVIIISTVRSSMNFIEFDLRHTLGFVANPRRFNVAVTRAQALLIVVGDPDVLGLDPLWRKFLNYIHNSGGWTGTRIGWDPKELPAANDRRDVLLRSQAESEMDELVRRTREMVLDSVPLDEREEEDAEVRRLEAAPDRPWREDE